MSAGSEHVQFKTRLQCKILGEDRWEQVVCGGRRDVGSMMGYFLDKKGMQDLESAAHIFIRDEIARMTQGDLSRAVKQGAYQEMFL